MIRRAAVEEALCEWMRVPTLILCVGNRLRGDDGAGPMVCGKLESPAAVDCGEAPERYLGLAGEGRAERVLVVDVMDFGGAPGEIAFCSSGELTERLGTTHDSGLAVLARFVEQEYGKPVAVLGIQPMDIRLGAEMSAPVQCAVETVSAWLGGAISQGKAEEMEGAWTGS